MVFGAGSGSNSMGLSHEIILSSVVYRCSEGKAACSLAN